MFYVWLGYRTVSCALPSYRDAVQWAREFAESYTEADIARLPPISVRTHRSQQIKR